MESLCVGGIAWKEWNGIVLATAFISTIVRRIIRDCSTTVKETATIQVGLIDLDILLIEVENKCGTWCRTATLQSSTLRRPRSRSSRIPTSPWFAVRLLISFSPLFGLFSRYSVVNSVTFYLICTNSIIYLFRGIGNLHRIHDFIHVTLTTFFCFFILPNCIHWALILWIAGSYLVYAAKRIFKTTNFANYTN